jgi:heterodisulfide reductase subunit A
VTGTPPPGPAEAPPQDASPRTGLVFCRCGSNLGKLIRIGELGQRARWPAVADVATHDVLCSPEGQAWLRARIEALGLERVVIAACSPKEHEHTFRGVLRAAGRNPWLMQMVNLREQVEWLGGEAGPASARAERLVRAGLARVAHHRPIPAAEIEVSADVVVVGGGPAGVSAALAMAGKDRRVVLLERSPALGGLANRLDQIFPDLSCASCFMEPALDAVLHHERVEVLTQAEVRAVKGSAGRFEVEVELAPRFVDPAACVGCGQCAAACPVERPDPWSAGLGTAKAIGPAYPGSLPHVSTLDPAACLRWAGQACDRCQAACPFSAIAFDAVPTRRTITAGAIVVATGLRPGAVDGPPGVISTFQLEQQLHPSGPTAGALRTPAGQPPRSLLLASTATESDGELAVRELLKLAHLVRQKHPGTAVAVAGGLHRAPGQAAGSRQLASEGVELLDAELLPGSALEAAGGVAVRLAQGLLETVRRFDLVAVHGPAGGAAGAADLARLLRLRLDGRGFVADGAASPFEPTATRVAGIFVAGAAAGPRPIHQAIRDGAAAAGRVLATLVAGEKRPLEPLAAEIDAARCGACGVCISSCAFGALRRDPLSGKAVLEPVHCHGCGTCAAACPTGAAGAPHYTREQLSAEIRALLAGTGTAG